MAQDRVEWKSVVAKVTGVFCELRGEKITKRREARKAKGALQREQSSVPSGLFGYTWGHVYECLNYLARLVLFCTLFCLEQFLAFGVRTVLGKFQS